MGLLESLSWMAWTKPTAWFFVVVFASVAVMILIEYKYPGGGPRQGILGMTTTRGDRLFITFLGAAVLFFLWLWLINGPLWILGVIVLLWATLIFAKA